MIVLARAQLIDAFATLSLSKISSTREFGYALGMFHALSSATRLLKDWLTHRKVPYYAALPSTL